MISTKIKLLIFNQLSKEITNSEIISYKGSTYIINRDNKFMYLELESDGLLWWRYPFFSEFFNAFSLNLSECEEIIIEWVKIILNFNVDRGQLFSDDFSFISTESILNHSISETRPFLVGKEAFVIDNLISTVYLYDPLNTKIQDVLDNNIK